MAHFLDLPIGVRNAIYKRLLALPHPIFLFQDTESQTESFAPAKPMWWLSLCYVNHQISREASAALYEANQFELADATHRQVRLLHSFLDCIGPANAASLSHLCINFPFAESTAGEPGQPKLTDDSLRALKLLQDQCTKLTTLETVVHSKNSNIFKEERSCLREALAAIDTQFRAITSLKTIVVRFVDLGMPPISAKLLMQELGWLVRMSNAD